MNCGHLFNGIKTIYMHPNRYSKIANPPKEVLENLYYNSFKTQSEIAIIFKTTQKVVFRWFKELGIKSRVAAKRFQKGEKNDSWKGDKATYSAKHYRVRAQRGKADHCELCGRCDDGIVYDWANLTGNYSDINDYLMMCRSCHYKMDEHYKNLPEHTTDKKINKKKLHDAVRSSL
jgi:ferredoxin